MQSNVLLEYQRVRKFFVAHGALVQHPRGWLGTVHTHVGLEVAFGCESSAADLALKRPLACVCTVVHLKRALAR